MIVGNGFVILLQGMHFELWSGGRSWCAASGLH
jgi:hypothetical protein